MTRTHAPIFWLLFGAGGMLAALLGAVLVFITGLAVPLGWPLPGDLLAYSRMHAFMGSGFGKLAVFGMIALFAWHAAHRLLCSVHDLGIHKGLLAKSIAYGAAGLLSIVVAVALARIG
jgi:fumarate reductase subunit D